jgi:hypothetical protein
MEKTDIRSEMVFHLLFQRSNLTQRGRCDDGQSLNRFFELHGDTMKAASQNFLLSELRILMVRLIA